MRGTPALRAGVAGRDSSEVNAPLPAGTSSRTLLIKVCEQEELKSVGYGYSSGRAVMMMRAASSPRSTDVCSPSQTLQHLDLLFLLGPRMTGSSSSLFHLPVLASPFSLQRVFIKGHARQPQKHEVRDRSESPTRFVQALTFASHALPVCYIICGERTTRIKP